MENLRNVNQNEYVPFDTMNELVQAMTKNAKVWTWGAHAYTNYGNIFLRFKVDGNLFKGWVYIGVNGSDLFDVFFTNSNMDIIHQCKDVYLDSLIGIIDEKIEKIPGYKW